MGKRNTLTLAGVEPHCSAGVRFVDSLKLHNFRPDSINLRENKFTQILERILFRIEFLKQCPVG